MHFNMKKNHFKESKFTSGELPANPFTFSVSASLRNEGRSSCLTLASPLYIKSNISVNSWYPTSLRTTIGCWQGFS